MRQVISWAGHAGAPLRHLTPCRLGRTRHGSSLAKPTLPPRCDIMALFFQKVCVAIKTCETQMRALRSGLLEGQELHLSLCDFGDL